MKDAARDQRFGGQLAHPTSILGRMRYCSGNHCPPIHCTMLGPIKNCFVQYKSNKNDCAPKKTMKNGLFYKKMMKKFKQKR
ncbi:MAG: hypothetical protein HYZ45_15080 [Burkholderiales bacterium]|nr:hypothetical protein [Burkholderiales bacterium]